MKLLSCLSGLVIICAAVQAQSVQTAPARLLSPRNAFIQYEGRISRPDPETALFCWPGNSATIHFRGTSVTAILRDQHGNNFYNIILDGDSIRMIRPDSSRKKYLLASGLTTGNHTVEIFRRTGWSGMTWFYGFELDGGASPLPIPPKKRLIEFYGNSITVGSGMYPDHAPGGHENNYESYAAITARHFQARYSCIARSGIGLMVSWFPMLMADLYNRENPFDSSSRWPFSDPAPDVVVVNLFQNDCALLDTMDYPECRRRFGSKKPGEEYIVDAYAHFVRTLRGHYPRASIICVLGSMDAVKPGSPWPGYIEKAVAGLKDPRVYTHFFAYKNTPGHPDPAEHREMARSLTAFIEKNIRW